MPHTFGTQIPPDKLNQLVQYLAQGQPGNVTDVAHAHTRPHAAPPAPTGLRPG